MAGGSAEGSWDGRPHLTLEQTGLIDGVATNNGGDPGNRLIVPGDLAHSIVLNRVAETNGFTRMPPIGSTEIDQGAVDLLTAWINELGTPPLTYEQWRIGTVGDATSAEGAPDANPDGDSSNNEQEFLAGTDPLDPTSFFSYQFSFDGTSVWFVFTTEEARDFVIESSTDLKIWAPWSSSVSQAGVPTQYEAVSTGPRRFFRLRLVP